MSGQLAAPESPVLAVQLSPPSLRVTSAPGIGVAGSCVTSMRFAVICAGLPTSPPGWLALRLRKLVSLPATHLNVSGAERMGLFEASADARTASLPGNTPR